MCEVEQIVQFERAPNPAKTSELQQKNTRIILFYYGLFFVTFLRMYCLEFETHGALLDEGSDVI